MEKRTNQIIWSSALIMLFATPIYAVELSGKIGWAETIVLSTNLSGDVIKADAQPGQSVKRGETLAQLRGDVLLANVAGARAALAHSEMALEEAQGELERTQELYDRTLLSDHDLNLARIAHAEAESMTAQAKASLKLASYYLEKSHIRAPFDAVVLARHVSVGETVNGSLQPVPLYTVAKADERLVILNARANQFELGATASILVDGKPYSGKVYALNHGEAGVEVEVRFPVEALNAPLPGQPAKVQLP